MYHTDTIKSNVPYLQNKNLMYHILTYLPYLYYKIPLAYFLLNSRPITLHANCSRPTYEYANWHLIVTIYV